MIVFVVAFCSWSNMVIGQEKESIVDFYEYANKEWLDNIIIPEKNSVVNNWGVLWDEIINKSIEILSGDVTYNLNENNQYRLTQLQNFYKSTVEYSADERKRVYLIQKHYPMIYGVIFSEITIPKDKYKNIERVIKYLTLAYKQKIENTAHIGRNNIDFFISILEDIRFVIGSPDISHFPKMPQLSVSSLETNIRLSKEYQLSIRKDKSYWESPPFETDCRYNIYENTVKVYAGTLFATNFSDKDDFANLFATLGRTIAHEMTHAFDMHRKKFNRNDWKNIEHSLVKQFNQYEIQEGYHIDGKKTFQENFADLGALEVSLLALKLFIKENCPNCSNAENLKIIESYFISYARFWREKATPEFEISSLTRMHTPQKFRAIGPIYNQDEFYEIYEIDICSKYYIPKDLRISIW